MILSLFLISSLALANPQTPCEQRLDPPRVLEVADTVSHQVADQVTSKTSLRGYGVLIGTMVGSAVLTSTLSAHLPPDFQFASIFISQVSTLGVYVLGAPIWEPLSSRFRKWAFGLRNEEWARGHSSGHLEETWTRTQENYSLNAQMSRNVLSQFILTVKDNFYQAYRAHQESNSAYAADQVAEAAFRMRILFKEISPTDPSVAAAVSSAFTHHVTVDREMVDLIWKRLSILDANLSDFLVRNYYKTVLATWLGVK